MKTLTVILACLSLTASSYSQHTNWEEDAAPLHRAEKALTDIIVHDIFSPTVASRIYAYSNIAAYEVLAKSANGYGSLHTKIASLPDIPAPPEKISYSLSAVYAFLLTSNKLIFSEHMLADSLQQILRWYKLKNIRPKMYNASLVYGKQVSDIIMKWVVKDQYAETRRIRRYNLSKEQGKWAPTPPGYMAAVEPYWNKIRTLTLDSAAQFRPAPPVNFSRESGSAFYRQAFEVYDAVKNLSGEQRAVANFWDCNPFFLNTQGHLNFAAKKISPGGHWISIARLASIKKNADITKAAATYTLTAIAIFDAFISCWDEKFRSNLIRPETYINATIDESWRPLLQTPPFPEYPSGHSVISTAAAIVLTKLFGDNFVYDDDTEVEFGLPVRRFTSFMQACNEAAISRLYGGIHYRQAIENGQLQGKQVGEWVIKKIQLKQ